MKIKNLIPDNTADTGEDHFSINAETPLRSDAFEKSDDVDTQLYDGFFSPADRAATDGRGHRARHGLHQALVRSRHRHGRGQTVGARHGARSHGQ